MTDTVMCGLAYLSRVVEPPCPQLSALVARVGPVEAANWVKRGVGCPKRMDHLNAVVPLLRRSQAVRASGIRRLVPW
jgi:hypothetical protein